MAITRRKFIKASAGAAAAATFATVVPLRGAEKKIRFAQIGCSGRGKAHHGMWKRNEFVASCDYEKGKVDMFNKNAFPDLIRETNYIKMYEKALDKIDAVIVATPDHHHFGASMIALQAGKAVYCEKPLAWSVKECLDLKAMAEKKQVATQMGNQGNSQQGWRDCYNIIHSGVIGKVLEVKTWTNRPVWPQGTKDPGISKEPIPVPKDVDWDAFLGPAPERPYRGKLNFKWRGWYDYGCGALGDMACHTTNAMFQIMKPEYDCTVEPIKVEGRNKDLFPDKEIIKYTFAKKGDCPGFDAYWYDGNLKPEVPKHMGGNKLPRTGSMFIGEKGVLITKSDYNDRPEVFREGQKIKPEGVKKLAPPTNGSIHDNFLKAVKGEIKWNESCSNFSYSGKMTAIINLGIIAEQVDKKITFNGDTMKFDDEKANKLMGRTPRSGWEKAYKLS
jgi:predicted dehydrogenase